MAGIDTKTRYQGVYARHQLHCALKGGRRCNCTPRCFGVVWDCDAHKHRKTRYYGTAGEANNARSDLAIAVREGLSDVKKRLTFMEVEELFVADARAGVALNKRGKPYTRKAVTNLESSLRTLPDWVRDKSVDKVSRGDFQRIVDDCRKNDLSASRIRSRVHAARSLYRWARDHELATGDPAAGLRLPAEDSESRDRIATPAEFKRLLVALEPADALPFALAAYGSARAQEVEYLGWQDVDLESSMMLLAADEEALKSDAARRVVPIAKPLAVRLDEEWRAQGEPKAGPVCPPRKKSRSGRINLGALQRRVFKVWMELGHEPIGMQDCRHTAATWLDHANVSPKVSSVIMGHRAPKRQPDVAPITLRRYTHVLEGELERARRLLDAFIVEREKDDPFDGPPGCLTKPRRLRSPCRSPR